MIVSYFSQLATLADARGIDLKQAFLEAGVPDSTYYRARAGLDLHARTAQRVASWLARRDEHLPAAE